MSTCRAVVAGGRGWFCRPDPSSAMVEKTFDGEVLTRRALLDLIERAIGVKKQFVIEAYLMTKSARISVRRW